MNFCTKTHLECEKTRLNFWKYMQTAIKHALEIMMNTL